MNIREVRIDGGTVIRADGTLFSFEVMEWPLRIEAALLDYMEHSGPYPGHTGVKIHIRCRQRIPDYSWLSFGDRNTCSLDCTADGNLGIQVIFNKAKIDVDDSHGVTLLIKPDTEGVVVVTALQDILFMCASSAP